MSLIRIIALILAASSCLFAQEPVPPAAPEPNQGPQAPPSVPVRGRQGLPPRPNAAMPPANAGEPAAEAPKPASAPDPQPGIPLGENTITEDIVEPKLSGNALAGLYRKYTGRRVIVSKAAADAEFSFVQEASPQDPLTFDKAAELLRKAATIENFVFVPDAQDPNLDVLTLATGGLRPTGRGVDVYNENDPLPDGDAVISYVMTLNYIKPAEAVNTFTQIIGPIGAFGSIAAVPNASAVVITENTSLIRKLIDLKKEIDKPGSVQATRFFKVQYADVTEIAETISELLSAQQEGQKTAGIQRADTAPAANGAPAQAGAPGAATAGEDTPVQIVPDPRTNRIFAMGRPVDLFFVEGLVREFDVETSEKNFLRRKLKFLTVSEFLPIASDALTRAFSGTGGEGGQTGTQGGGQNANRPQNQPRQETSTSRGLGNRNSTMGSNSSGMGGSGSGSGFGGGGSGGLSDPSVSTAPESVLVGRTLLVADNITNSIVVQGPPAGLEIVQRLIDQLDTKPDQVLISCVFGQLGISDGWSFGMDYVRTLNGNVAGRGGSGVGSFLPLSDKFKDDPDTTNIDESIFNVGSLPGTSGLGVYGLIGNSLNVYLNAKQEDSNFKILSRPTIFTANNQKGSIVSGTRLAVPTNSYTTGTSDSASTNFEYQDVALKLEVIPLVNSNSEITLKIYLTSDDIGENREVGTGNSKYEIPDILNRELITTVTVPNNETVVLGGLITETTKDNQSGIPILSRIPGIGPLFGTKSKDTSESELIVFIQPSIVRDPQTLNDAQTDMDRRYNISPDARDFANPPPPEAVPVEEPKPAKKQKSRSGFRPPNR
ncbi:MAG: secretin N-terminal domain-containing protein [Verrucomicrobiota bacterium]